VRRYAESTGREAALEMLHTVLLKFPDTVVEEQIDSLFFPLVIRLVNEESNQVRTMIGTILKVLMGQVGPRSLQRIVDFAISWYRGADQRLWRAAALVRILLLLHATSVGFCFEMWDWLLIAELDSMECRFSDS
jgi:U3 small nucleolar RNA-associated protein 20